MGTRAFSYSRDYREEIEEPHKVFGILRDNGLHPLNVHEGYDVGTGTGIVIYTFRQKREPSKNRFEALLRSNGIDLERITIH